MQNKLLMFSIAILLSMTVLSSDYDYAMDGGMIKKPGVQKGRVVFANCQEKVPVSRIERVAKSLESELNIQIDVEPGSFAFPPASLKAEACLYVVDDASIPTLLSAPESRWAVVNVATLQSNNRDVFIDRVEKELVRGFALLGGSFMSQFPNPMVGCVTKAEQLDEITTSTLPFDAMTHIVSYLEGYGIMPYEPLSYREACQEGWAPMPQNDIQQKIWDEVHTIPSEPIKIKYQKK